MSKTQSPNIVKYTEHGVSKNNDVYWIVMERLQGQSLDRLFDKLEKCPLPETEVIKVSVLALHDQFLFPETGLLLNPGPDWNRNVFCPA